MSDLEKVIEELIEKRKSISEKYKNDVKNNEDLEIELAIANVKGNKSEVELLSFKKDIIEHLQTAKISHKKWMSFVQILIQLGDIDSANTTTPINYTLCDFGKWYYKSGAKLAVFPEYKEIEDIHKNVHDTYLKIYRLYLKPIKGSFFNSEKKQLIARNKEAKDLSIILDEYSKIMFDLLNSLENSIKNAPNDQLRSIL